MVTARRPWPPPETGAPVQPVGNRVPQAGCIESEFVRHQRLLVNTLVLAYLTMYDSPLVLRTRPPVDEEGEQVGCADGAVAVEGHCMEHLHLVLLLQSVGAGREAVGNSWPIDRLHRDLVVNDNDVNGRIW